MFRRRHCRPRCPRRLCPRRRRPRRCRPRHPLTCSSRRHCRRRPCRRRRRCCRRRRQHCHRMISECRSKRYPIFVYFLKPPKKLTAKRQSVVQKIIPTQEKTFFHNFCFLEENLTQP